ncbi:MAG TPA: alpha/beta hydrolase-fold protein [Flavitalea sp.]|nr:alpha/beta hydrolase-fold protein [Flavitalea sp.]
MYSRHLQRQVSLKIFHTKIEGDRDQLNLLLLNDGADVEKLNAFSTVDSLFNAREIGPTVVVSIDVADRMQEYGVAGKPDFGKRGTKADNYDAFINNELLPYIKKKTETRKFRETAIAGASLGGLSAFDIGWNHADKFDAVGVFSGSFWWRDKDVSDSSYSNDNNRIVISKLKTSRKTPTTRFWFYAGKKEETSDRDKDGIIDVIDDTKDVIRTMVEMRKMNPSQITYKESAIGEHDWPYWAAAFPEFVTWAFHK